MRRGQGRLSGGTSCAARVVAAGIARVVVAVREPSAFIEGCRGIEELRAAGVRVDEVDDAECRALALAPNAHLLK